MGSYQNIFKRYEVKYLITKKEQELLLESIDKHIESDKYGLSEIRNIYFDTPDKLLIRRSIEKPIYKEKLRVRSYGKAESDSNVFVELKKKYKGVVYKRRIDMLESEAMGYLCGQNSSPYSSQISREIDYFLALYKNIEPSAFISYTRQAFYSVDDPNLRLTFDSDILWRNTEMSLTKENYGEAILNDDQVLMELKTASSFPLWLVGVMSELALRKTSFSKYGNAYKSMFNSYINGGNKNVRQYF